MGSASQNTQQQQQSTTSPWAPSQPVLQKLLSSLVRQPTAPTAGQNAATGALTTAAGGLPNYGPAAGSVTSGLLGGDPTGLLASGNSNLKDILSPIATRSLDPTQDPNIQNILQTIRQDVTKNVGDMYAGAGRDPAGAGNYPQTLARGFTQAAGPLLLGQYNQNVQDRINAGSQMFGANYNTAGGITGNQNAGLTAAGMVPQLQLAPALAQLQAAQTKYNLPLSNLAGVENLTLPIAGLGGSSVGSGSSNTTIDPSLLQQILMGSQAFNNVSSGLFPKSR